MTNHFGKCSWHGTLEEFLRFDRGSFLGVMKSRNEAVSAYVVGHPQYAAWRDMFAHLRRELRRLPTEYGKLHLAFEYVVPGHSDKTTGRVLYEKRPDVVMFSGERVLVMEFKQRNRTAAEVFSLETRGYLRLLEKWHPRVPRMSAKGALILTSEREYAQRFSRVRAVSPDRIASTVRKVFSDSLLPCADPASWLAAIDNAGAPDRAAKFHRRAAFAAAESGEVTDGVAAAGECGIMERKDKSRKATYG